MSSATNNQDSERPPETEGGSRRKNDPLLGKVINDRFEILSVIARGGMGKVYRAEQSPLGRICAVKVLNPKYEGDEDPEFQRRFYLEASTAAKLTHPNTVTIFDYGRDEKLDLYYIAMEYVRGRTLFHVLRQEGTLPEDRVAHVMREVGRSLREAHGLGVIHRDLKPANVVLTESAGEQDALKVLDFGLVKDVSGDDPEDLTQQGLFMGSPKYMAPEQILGNTVSPATDVYSLGVLAYELLTGVVPFDMGTSVKTLMAHVNDPPPPMRTVNPHVYLSAEMNSIVLKCLAKDPGDRYPSMDELLRALTAVEGGGTLTESLLAAPIVKVPADGDSGADPMESNPTRPMTRARPVGDSAPPSTNDTARSAGMRVSHAPSPAGESYDGPSSLFPSATPQPMTHLTLSDVEMPARSSAPIRVTIGVIALVGVVALGLALSRGDGETSVATPTPPPPSPTQGEALPATGAPEVRTVRVTSKPSGAKVEHDGRVLCGATPCDVTWRGADASTKHELLLTLEGHEATKVEVPVDQNEIAGRLEPKRGARPTPRPAAGPAPKALQPAPQPPATPAPAPQPPPKPKVTGYKDSPY